MTDTPKKKPLRSQAWFGRKDKDGFIHRSWMKNQGLPQHLFDGRPVIGICNTWSELTPCNAHFRKIAEHVKRGISEAGGFPVEFPVFSNGESNLRPTAMLTRNLASMDVEESIRGNPMDAGISLRSLLENQEPGAQEIADALLAEALRLDEGRPADDCSVVVLRVNSRTGDDIRRMNVRLPLKLG